MRNYPFLPYTAQTKENSSRFVKTQLEKFHLLVLSEEDGFKKEKKPKAEILLSKHILLTGTVERSL